MNTTSFLQSFPIKANQMNPQGYTMQTQQPQPQQLQPQIQPQLQQQQQLHQYTEHFYTQQPRPQKEIAPQKNAQTVINTIIFSILINIFT